MSTKAVGVQPTYGSNGWGLYQNGSFIGGGPGRGAGSTRHTPAAAHHSSRSRSRSPARDRPGSGVAGLLVLAAGIWWGLSSAAHHASLHHETMLAFISHAVLHWAG